MIIETIDPAHLKPEFNISCQRLLKSPRWDRTPFGLTWCTIDPHGETTLFAHHDEEVFIILDGQGEMIIGNEKELVYKGSVIQIPAFEWHQLINTSQDNPIVFLSIHTFFPNQPALPRSMLILSPPPTPNGPLHVGHLAGPYLGADILKRYLRMRGIPAHHQSGSDAYQSHLSVLGRRTGKTEQEISRQFTPLIEKSLNRAAIDLDGFMIPQNNEPFHDYVRGIFQNLGNTGKIQYQEIELPHCASCDRFLVEAHGNGTCPHCQIAISGSCCETCGQVTNRHQETICAGCGEKSTTTKTVSLPFFPLEEYRDWLKKYTDSAHLNAPLQKWMGEILGSPLDDFPLTLPLIWGIPVDKNNPKADVYHPWFEMACRYRWIQEESDLSASAETVLFFGCDNSYYYACFLPAIYRAMDKENQLPKTLISNQFYGYNGSKFSTSRQHGPTLDTFLDHVPVDIARFYLTFTSPQESEASFVSDDFSHFHTRTTNALKDWMSDCGKAVRRRNGIIPAIDQNWTIHQQDFYRTLNSLVITAEQHYHPHHFSPKNAAFLVQHLMAFAATFLKSARGHGAIDDVDFVLNLTGLKVFALIAAPILPDSSHQILTILGEPLIWEKEVGLVQPKTITAPFVLLESNRE